MRRPGIGLEHLRTHGDEFFHAADKEAEMEGGIGMKAAPHEIEIHAIRAPAVTHLDVTNGGFRQQFLECLFQYILLETRQRR